MERDIHFSTALTELYIRHFIKQSKTTVLFTRKAFSAHAFLGQAVTRYQCFLFLSAPYPAKFNCQEFR